MNEVLHDIYYQLPVFLQNIAVSGQGYRIGQRRYDSEYEKVFGAAQQRQRFSTSQLHIYKRRRLKAFLHLARRAPFWNQRFLKYGVNLNSNDIYAELKKLPVLTKEIVKNHVDDIYPKNISRNSLHFCHTSGTTGSGLVFAETPRAEKEQWAVWWRYRSWYDLDHSTWCGYFGGRTIVPISQKSPPFWRYNVPGRQLMFSTYHLRPESARSYIAQLRRCSIKWLHGYPSILSQLAGYVLDQDLGSLPALQIITTGAESLLAQQRAQIEHAFHVPVREHYGQAESVANISQLPDGKFRVDEDFSFVEFLHVEDERYQIIGTNWTNPAFPLIRYATDDVATLSSQPHPLKEVRYVKEVDGRIEDYVTLPDGTKVGRLDHLFKDIMTIHEAQIYQPDRNTVIFRIVPRDGFQEEDKRQLLRDARKRLGNDLSFVVNYQDELERSDTGKLRFVISEV